MILISLISCAAAAGIPPQYAGTRGSAGQGRSEAIMQLDSGTLHGIRETISGVGVD